MIRIGVCSIVRTKTVPRLIIPEGRRVFVGHDDAELEFVGEAPPVQRRGGIRGSTLITQHICSTLDSSVCVIDVIFGDCRV